MVNRTPYQQLQTQTSPHIDKPFRNVSRPLPAGEAPDKFPSPLLVQQITGQDAAKVRELEVQVCSILQGNTGAISALRILHLYLERMGCDFQVRLGSLVRMYRGRGRTPWAIMPGPSCLAQVGGLHLQAAAVHLSQQLPFSSAS